MEPVTSQTLQEWQKDNLVPILVEVSSILAQQGDKNDVDILFAHWWAIFFKNSLALFQQLTGVVYSSQINMTLRLLMEMSADVEFINKNRMNIEGQKKRHNKIIRKAEQLGGLTYKQLADEGKNFHLFRYNGRQRGEEVKTTMRVKEAYNAEDYSFYEYLSCFTHFNYLGIMYDLNLSLKPQSPESVEERLRSLRFYSKIFEKEVSAMGDLCNIDEVKNYDCTKLHNLLEELTTVPYYDYFEMLQNMTGYPGHNVT